MYDRDIASDGLSSWLSSVTYQDGTPLPTKHPFTAEVAARVVTEGGDIYCIVPAHAGDSVSICQWLYSTTDDGQWSEKAGDTLYASDTSEPVLIQASAGGVQPQLRRLHPRYRRQVIREPRARDERHGRKAGPAERCRQRPSAPERLQPLRVLMAKALYVRALRHNLLLVI